LSWRVVSSAPAVSLDCIGPSFQNISDRDQLLVWRDVVESTGSSIDKWPVYQWSELPVTKRFIGPALIEDPYTTIVVSSFFNFEMDERSSVHLWDKEAANDDKR
jgi:N-methylhydantoinase A/oxoprolinase/acetone carboxylase beta subunit